MNRTIGFSTGVMNQCDIISTLSLFHSQGIHAVEVSFKEKQSVEAISDVLESPCLRWFSHVAVHVPITHDSQDERSIADYLYHETPANYLIVAHPKSISATNYWNKFGERLCVENVGRGESTGRNVAELEAVFASLPNASFCFDIGHARWVDPTMTAAALILRKHHARLRQIHLSEISSSGNHEPISLTAFNSFRKVSHLIHPCIPIILETPVSSKSMTAHIEIARKVFQTQSSEDLASSKTVLNTQADCLPMFNEKIG